MTYQHRFLDQRPVGLPVGKALCVARNYLEHIRELHNAVPEAPILFMKPAAALVSLDQPITWPADCGSCHYETELAVLIGHTLRHADATTARAAVAGYAIALDLTLRDVQTTLKKNGHPWEIAKAFDGACPISPILRPEDVPDPQATPIQLHINGTLRQDGHTHQMMVGIFDLIAYASTYFTLAPGDVVLTGTPAGVGPLHSGDALTLSLGTHRFTAQVA